jgi:hypothetical protein
MNWTAWAWACGAQRLRLQPAHVPQRVVLVPAELARQALRVEGPALREAREAHHPPHQRQRELLRDAQLQVMAGDGLVIGQGAHPDAGLGPGGGGEERT